MSMQVTGLTQDSRTDAGDAPLVIGIVNNMPDAALQTTEQQFRDLITSAAAGRPTKIRFFYVPEVPRSEAGRQYASMQYENIRELWSASVDGLIVTGNEPHTPDLSDEPYWPVIAKLVDWSRVNTASTIWSCLAAHAAVLRLDGIRRELLGAKLSGVFECKKAVAHPLLSGIPPRWRIPHSRYNGLSEELLVSAGYRVLSRSRETGADTFIKEDESLFLFFQGHPEYDADSLLREYRRDIARFLEGKKQTFPDAPAGYFCGEINAALTNLRERALRQRSPELLGEFRTIVAEQELICSWRPFATRLYANWFSFLREPRASWLREGDSVTAKQVANEPR